MLRKTALSLALVATVAACSSSKKTAPTSKLTSGTAPDTYSNTFSTSQAKLLDNETFQLDSISLDPTHGYSKDNSIHVGGTFQEGAKNQRRFLNALLGPNNEVVTFNRRGSCCAFNTRNGFSGGGLLDAYEVTYEGLDKPIILYLNFYDYGILRATKGFTFKK